LQFPITANEAKQAENDPDFLLIAVTQARNTSAKLWRFRGCDMNRKFRLIPLSFMAIRK
jgi:hypothetical protein